jgi:ATP-dependent Clp protease ATP-binding subunit ClpX
LVRQYEKLLELENIDLEFTEGALKAVAEKAMIKNTGARGLRTIMEGRMLDLMYDIPSREDDVVKIILDEGFIDGSEPPRYVLGSDEEVA